MRADKIKWISLRIRLIYFKRIVKQLKTVEYRKNTHFWRVRLLDPPRDREYMRLSPTLSPTYSIIDKPYTFMAAVFVSGHTKLGPRMYRCPVTYIELLLTPKSFSPQGKLDVDTPTCFGIHLEKRPDDAVKYDKCKGPFCKDEDNYEWLYSYLDGELWCEGCIDEARSRAQDADYVEEISPEEMDEMEQAEHDERSEW